MSSLERDPLLAERIKRLRTVPGVGPITALTWALEIGDVARFRSIRQAISYCGLCGAEKSSADKVLRTPLSKQRNKHIQHVLVEAAKLAPRQNHELALIYDKEKQKGNANRATLAVARKMVAYLLAVDRREREFVPAEDYKTERRPRNRRLGKEKKQDYTVRRLPGPAGGRLSEGDQTPEAPFELFRDWQRTQTQSSVKASGVRDSKWMSGSAKAGTTAERHRCELRMPANADVRAPPKRASGELCFLLTKTYMDVGNTEATPNCEMSVRSVADI